MWDVDATEEYLDRFRKQDLDTQGTRLCAVYSDETSQ